MCFLNTRWGLRSVYTLQNAYGKGGWSLPLPSCASPVPRTIYVYTQLHNSYTSLSIQLFGRKNIAKVVWSSTGLRIYNLHTSCNYYWVSASNFELNINSIGKLGVGSGRDLGWQVSREKVHFSIQHRAMYQILKLIIRDYLWKSGTHTFLNTL